MTIDDLKALDKTDLMYAFDELGDEILALVEAANMIRGAQVTYIDTDGHPDGYKLLDAIDAFNAKLESFRA